MAHMLRRGISTQFQIVISDFDLRQSRFFPLCLTGFHVSRRVGAQQGENDMKLKTVGFGLGPALVIAAGTAMAASDTPQVSDVMSRSGFILENGLAIPPFDAEKGRKLFAAKGCVVCHSVNGIGGEDAPEFAADYMDYPMNAFEFAARMWRGAEAMVMMQQEELGEQIELTGEELAAIIAFLHDKDEQAKFSQADIPHDIEELMHGGEEEEEAGDDEGAPHQEAEEHPEGDAGPTGHDEPVEHK